MENQNLPWDKSFTRGSYNSYLSDVFIDLYKLYKVLFPGNNALDIGCGLGNNSIFLAQNGLNVVAFDYSEVPLKILKDKIEDESYNNNIRIVKGSIDKIPFGENYFDLIISTSLIHHGIYKNRRKWLNEINRVLKKNGLLVLSILSKNDKRYGTGIEIEPNTFVGIKDTFDPEVPHHFYTIEELKKEIGGYEDGDFDINSIENYRYEIHKRDEIEETIDINHKPFTHHYIIAIKDSLLFLPPHLFTEYNRRNRKVISIK